MVAFDIVFVDFPFREHDGRSANHPAIVLEDGVVVPCSQVSSQVQKYNGPLDYHLLDWKDAGLDKASVVQLGRVEQFSDADVQFIIGHLSERDIENIKNILNKK